MITFGSLYAGLGGFDLGFERAGMRCEWQVEIDADNRTILREQFPSARQWDDVRTFPPPGEWGVDLVCGGFPCQDISNAGECAGIDGERSGLWTEYARVIREIRPRYVVVENVAALLVRGMDRVLGDLAALGFDAEWDCYPACAFGARHLRDRVFIVAASGAVDDLDRFRQGCLDRPPEACGRWMQNAPIRSCFDGGAWASEPGVGRVAYGVPKSVDRVCRLGNAVVPQVAEWIGRRIIESEVSNG